MKIKFDLGAISKYYPQVFLNECLYQIYKCYIMIEFTFLKEVILIKLVNQKSVMFNYY